MGKVELELELNIESHSCPGLVGRSVGTERCGALSM